jgi:hypothetical protein
MGKCKSEHRDFKKSKKNMGQCNSEGKDLTRDYAKEKQRENMGWASLRKETLKNRKRRL